MLPIFKKLFDLHCQKHFYSPKHPLAEVFSRQIITVFKNTQRSEK